MQLQAEMLTTMFIEGVLLLNILEVLATTDSRFIVLGAFLIEAVLIFRQNRKLHVGLLCNSNNTGPVPSST